MFGQIPDFTNGFEFLRNLWGSGSGMPGGLMPGLQAMTPPMDLDEVDKRIHDLKAVESWLQLNTNLLRTTIQGLEVQRATLVALQTFGNALSPDAMQSAMENVARAANAPSAAPHHHTFAMPGHEPEDVEAMDAEEEDEDYDYAADDDNTEALPDDEAPPETAGAAGEEDAGSGSGAGSGTEAGSSDALPPNAALWWNLLQQQFNQIASSAAAASIAPFGNLGGFGTGGATGPASAQPAPKPEARGTAKPARGGAKASDKVSGKGGARTAKGGTGKSGTGKSGTGKAGTGKAGTGKAAAKKTAARSGTGATSAQTAAATSARPKPTRSRQGSGRAAPQSGPDTSGGDDTA